VQDKEESRSTKSGGHACSTAQPGLNVFLFHMRGVRSELKQTLCQTAQLIGEWLRLTAFQPHLKWIYLLTTAAIMPGYRIRDRVGETILEADP